MDGYKHYLRTNEAGTVIHGFSDAFEQAQAGDIQLSGDYGRHFQVRLTNDRGQPIYKIENGQMMGRSQAELDAEWNARPHTPTLEERLKALEDIELDRMLGGF